MIRTYRMVGYLTPDPYPGTTITIDETVEAYTAEDAITRLRVLYRGRGGKVHLNDVAPVREPIIPFTPDSVKGMDRQD